MNPFAQLAIWLIRGYQITLSPFFGNSCRFSPTCSQYGVEAFQIHGFFKGAWLTINRIRRCHPWNEGGLDPVPPKCCNHPQQEDKGS